MKPKITPVDREVLVPPDRFIISKTDLKGRITYVNRTFMEVANYPESALLGKQHNIVRHPDMPRGVYRFLWNTLAEGNEFFGFVKNMTSDGAYYWVFANVTPDYDAAGRVQGYYSVRRRPPRSAIETVEPIYREMLSIEQASGTSEAPDASLDYLRGQVYQSNTTYEALVLDLYQRGER